MFGAGKKTTIRVEFPTNQILKLLFIICGAFLVLKLREVIIIIFLSFILMASTKPSVELLTSKLRIPKGLSIFIVYILILLIFGVSLYFVSKPLANELKTFSDSIPSILQNAVDRFPLLQGKVDPNSVSNSIRDAFTNIANDFSNVGSYLQNALSITVSAFGFILHLITVIIISVYMLLERESILGFIIRVFRFDQERFYEVYDRIEFQLGAWVRGQLFLGFIVGVFTWIGLVSLGIKFALPLAFLAGLLEIVPIIGPIISAVPLTLIGLSMSPVKGLLALGLAIVVQQLEGHLLVPTVMKRAVGLSSVVTLVSLLIGSQLLGLIGSIIAVPIAAMVSVIVNSFLEYRERE
jgi:predicted PurR-regulated permease PerM